MDRLVTVYGGSGFIGRHVVRALARQGWRVRVAVRRPDLAFHLQPLGGVGQVTAVQANLRYPASVRRAAEGAHAVVNLVGILAEGGRQTFANVHEFGARAVAEAAADVGANLVQISSIGADKDSPSAYARSKAAAEAAVRAVVPDAVIVRPSVVFGPEDTFLNRFAAMARISPVLPLFGGGETRFQPVFVGDVAAAIASAVGAPPTERGRPVDASVPESEEDEHPSTHGIYELGGPEVKTFRELMEFVLAATGRSRFLVPVPGPIATLKAAVLERLPGKLLTRDQLAQLAIDNVVSEAAQKEGRTLAAFGVQPTSIEAVAPTYLWRFRKAGQFTQVTS